jgi:diguanylate cyclase (GGDEF)-like protein
MRAGFDSKQVVARYGGEEFVVLLKATSHADALMRAEYFRELVESTPFENEHTQPLGRVTISIGVSTFPEHGQEMTTLIKIADDALYQAKKASRNLVVSADALETKSAA